MRTVINRFRIIHVVVLLGVFFIGCGSVFAADSQDKIAKAKYEYEKLQAELRLLKPPLLEIHKLTLQKDVLYSSMKYEEALFWDCREKAAQANSQYESYKEQESQNSKNGIWHQLTNPADMLRLKMDARKQLQLRDEYLQESNTHKANMNNAKKDLENVEKEIASKEAALKGLYPGDARARVAELTDAVKKAYDKVIVAQGGTPLKSDEEAAVPTEVKKEKKPEAPKFVGKTENTDALDDKAPKDDYMVVSIAADAEKITKNKVTYSKLRNTDSVAIVLRMRGEDSIISGYDAVMVLLEKGYLKQVQGVGLVLTTKSIPSMADAGSAPEEASGASGDEIISCQEFAKCSAQLGSKLNSPLDKNKDQELYWKVVLCRNKRTACNEAKKRGEEEKKLSVTSPQATGSEPDTRGLGQAQTEQTTGSPDGGLLGADFDAPLAGQGPSNSDIFKPVGSTTPTVRDAPNAQAQPAVVPDTADEPYDPNKEWKI